MNVKTDILSEYLLLMKTKKALGIHKWVYNRRIPRTRWYYLHL